MLESKIQSIVMTFGLFDFLVSGFFSAGNFGFFFCFGATGARSCSPVFSSCKNVPKFSLPLVRCSLYLPIVCIFPSVTVSLQYQAQ